MSQTPPADLGARLEALGRELGAREAAFQGDLAHARAVADKLRARIEEGLVRFQRAAASAGAPHLCAAVSETRVDDKHLRAVQLDLSRGRHRAIVTVKARGEVTLVGPFHAGKTEGPCRSFPIDSAAEIDAALAIFLESFLEQAATP
jgi:hypothetical protein